jgi:hypothetical protein
MNPNLTGKRESQVIKDGEKAFLVQGGFQTLLTSAAL